MLLLQLYFWAILAAAVAAPTLAVIGGHLAARDRAMETLCIGQGASLGVLVGIGVLQTLDAPERWLALGPFFTATLFSAVTFFLGERIIVKHQASRNTYFSAIFATLLGLGYLVCALFPALENHMAHAFFGDLATMSNDEAFISIFLGIALLITLAFKWRKLSRESFHIAVFGEGYARAQGASMLFTVLSLLVISFSVQFMGFLFTIACLFLPTTLGLGVRMRGLKVHFFVCMFIAVVATVTGFSLSLSFSRLPTVPTIVTLMVVLGLLCQGLGSLRPLQPIS